MVPEGHFRVLFPMCQPPALPSSRAGSCPIGLLWSPCLDGGSLSVDPLLVYAAIPQFTYQTVPRVQLWRLRFTEPVGQSDPSK